MGLGTDYSGQVGFSLPLCICFSVCLPDNSTRNSAKPSDVFVQYATEWLTLKSTPPPYVLPCRLPTLLVLGQNVWVINRGSTKCGCAGARPLGRDVPDLVQTRSSPRGLPRRIDRR